VRQFFAAIIKRVVIGRRAARAILQYMNSYTDFGTAWPLNAWHSFTQAMPRRLAAW